MLFTAKLRPVSYVRIAGNGVTSFLIEGQTWEVPDLFGYAVPNKTLDPYWRRLVGRLNIDYAFAKEKPLQ
jgi:hypothetical protein